MLTVSAREANHHFSRLLRAAAAGEEVIITRRGTPVARLGPVGDDTAVERREVAIRRMRRMLQTGIDLGGDAWPGRGQLYDDATRLRPWPMSASTPAS